MEEFNRLMQEAHEELAEQCGKPGWTYKDLPRMTPKLADELFEIIGEGNYALITWADYAGESCRGQILVSPQGMENLRARVS